MPSLAEDPHDSRLPVSGPFGPPARVQALSLGTGYLFASNHGRLGRRSLPMGYPLA